MSPYIKDTQREKWEGVLTIIKDVLSTVKGEDLAGELNYLITSIVHSSHTPSYRNYNEILGVLEAVKLELYRRKIGPYEDEKIKLNGDVV